MIIIKIIQSLWLSGSGGQISILFTFLHLTLFIFSTYITCLFLHDAYPNHMSKYMLTLSNKNLLSNCLSISEE